MIPYYAIIVVVLLLLKLFIWATYYYLRRRRVQQMLEAGQICRAPTPGTRYPPIVTHGQTQGVYAHANYNTNYWTPQATPPSYQDAVKQAGPPSEAPPSYSEKAP